MDIYGMINNYIPYINKYIVCNNNNFINIYKIL